MINYFNLFEIAKLSLTLLYGNNLLEEKMANSKYIFKKLEIKLHIFVQFDKTTGP